MDTTQRGVARGVGFALATVVTVFGLAAGFGPAILVGGADPAARAALAAWSLLPPVLMLLVSVARVANHRFHTPADVHGSGLTRGTDRVRLLQALLQNTLEQCCLALPVYVAAAVVAPAAFLPLVPAAAGMFAIGRLFFFAGYAGGAPSRAFGFALTFYPTGLLILLLLAVGLWRAVT